jgi:hypothetical protein
MDELEGWSLFEVAKGLYRLDQILELVSELNIPSVFQRMPLIYAIHTLASIYNSRCWRCIQHCKQRLLVLVKGSHIKIASET